MLHLWDWTAKQYKIIAPLSGEERQLAIESIDARLRNCYLLPCIFNYVIWATFVLFVVLCTLRRVANYASTHLSPRRRTSLHPALGSLKAGSSRFFTNAPLFGSHHAQPFQLGSSKLTVQVPLRAHALLLMLYGLFNLLVVVAFYSPTPGPTNYYWPAPTTFPQISRYFADRTGILALGQFPLLIVLAGRNSPVELLTGASFETLMLYHRWVARTISLQALGHAIGYTVYYLHTYVKPKDSRAPWRAGTYGSGWFCSGGREAYTEAVKDHYVQWGLAAVVLFCLLCVFSLRAFRQAAYEVFITFHILFAVFALVGVYYHIYLLRSSKMAEFLHFIWAACVFWAFDRVARLARLLFINVHLPFLGGAGTAGTTPLCSRGTVTALPDDSMRVRIHPAGRALAMFGKMRPGSNVFLRVPRIQPWASHPFTVIEQRWEATESESYVDLIVNPVDGFTKRLAKRVASQPREMVMLLEGPYGSPPDLETIDILHLVAGGVGITFCLPLLTDIMRRSCLASVLPTESDDNEKQIPQNSATKQLRLTWIIKSKASLAMALPYLLEVAQVVRTTNTTNPAPSVSISIFLTNTANPTAPSIKSPSIDKNHDDEKILPREDDGELTPSELVPTFEIGNNFQGATLVNDQRIAQAAQKAAQAEAQAQAARPEENERDIDAQLESLRDVMQIRLFSGRPNLDSTVQHGMEEQLKMIEAGCESGGKGAATELAFATCGPAGMCDDVRTAVLGQLGKVPSAQAAMVRYYEDAFTW